MEDYRNLNATLNIYDEDGLIQFDKDQEAARAYFLQHVNQNMVFFHSLKEKADHLTSEGLWDKRVVERYPFDQFKALFKEAYSLKFRFKTFVGALKFFEAYALRTRDGKRYYERFEDRAVMTAIEHSSDYLHAQRLVHHIIEGRFQPATPTFLNAGRADAGGPTSCYLLRVEDNLESISRAQSDAAQLSKRGGGVALSLTNIRETGAPIKRYENKSSGLIPFMKLLEDTFSYIDQLGQRQGAGAVYLNAHHPDILRFLDTKRENADEKIRIKTLSIGVVIPDITFELAKTNQDMYLFSPYDVEREYGVPFSEISVTEEYEHMVGNPRIRKTKTNARKLFTTIAELQFESGYPYLMFEDTVNYYNPAPNVGRISMSNLCVTGDTELLTSKGYRRADDLWETQEDFEVIVDERARTMSLGNVGTSVQKSSKMVKTATDADVYKVTTSEGHEIKATEWHKFYVDRDGELVKIPLAELEIGDRLLVQGSENPSWGKEHNPDLAYLAGVIASDGTFYQTRGGEYGARIDLYGDKERFKGKVETAISTVLEGRDDLLHHSSQLSPKMIYSEGSDKWSLNSRPLGKLLLEEGFTPETKHQIPEFVKQGDRDTQQAYIDGVWALDGCITGSEKVGNISIELGSIDHNFLREMQTLLLGFGAYTRIYANRKVAGKNLLPDGKGGSKEYDVKPVWTLRAMDRTSREALHNLVEWRESTEAYWARRCANIKTNAYYNTHKYRAVVVSIEFYGVEDVYDPTVENGHSVIYNGLVTGQCSEILQPQTASTFNAAGEFEVPGRDVACNLGSLNVAKMMQAHEEDFRQTIWDAQAFLTNVATGGDFTCSPSIDNGNWKARAIGLGQMNLHGYFIENGIDYDSPEAVDIWRDYIAAVTFEVISASCQMAEDLGTNFHGFQGSDWQNGSMISKMIEALVDSDDPGIGPNSPLDLMHSASDWEELKARVGEHGLFNQHLQAIPPTGSISYVNNSTSSIHPVSSKIEIRKEGALGRVYYPAYGLTNENFDEVKTAYEIDQKAIIDMYAASTPFIDQGQSLTLFYTDEATTRDVNRAQIYAHKSGIKTVYYVRVQQAALEGTEIDGCVSCML